MAPPFVQQDSRAAHPPPEPLIRRPPGQVAVMASTLAPGAHRGRTMAGPARPWHGLAGLGVSVFRPGVGGLPGGSHTQAATATSPRSPCLSSAHAGLALQRPDPRWMEEGCSRPSRHTGAHGYLQLRHTHTRTRTERLFCVTGTRCGEGKETFELRRNRIVRDIYACNEENLKRFSGSCIFEGRQGSVRLLRLPCCRTGRNVLKFVCWDRWTSLIRKISLPTPRPFPRRQRKCHCVESGRLFFFKLLLLFPLALSLCPAHIFFSISPLFLVKSQVVNPFGWRCCQQRVEITWFEGPDGFVSEESCEVCGPCLRPAERHGGPAPCRAASGGLRPTEGHWGLCAPQSGIGGLLRASGFSAAICCFTVFYELVCCS